MLDLKGNITVENNPIIGHPANGTVAQQVRVSYNRHMSLPLM